MRSSVLCRKQAKWQSPLADYLADYQSLIGDRRTAMTFGAAVQGIIEKGNPRLCRGDLKSLTDLGVV